MKKLKKPILLSLAILGVVAAQAQSRYQVGFGIQYNAPERWFTRDTDRYRGKNEGGGLYVELQRKVTERLRVGGKAEYVFVTEDARTDDVSVYEVTSLIGTGTYSWYVNRKFSSFVKLGAGVYHVFREKPVINAGVEAAVGVQYGVVQLSVGYDRIINRINYRYGIRGGFDNYYLPIRLGVIL